MVLAGTIVFQIRRIFTSTRFAHHLFLRCLYISEKPVQKHYQWPLGSSTKRCKKERIFLTNSQILPLKFMVRYYQFDPSVDKVKILDFQQLKPCPEKRGERPSERQDMLNSNTILNLIPRFGALTYNSNNKELYSVNNHSKEEAIQKSMKSVKKRLEQKRCMFFGLDRNQRMLSRGQRRCCSGPKLSTGVISKIPECKIKFRF